MLFQFHLFFIFNILSYTIIIYNLLGDKKDSFFFQKIFQNFQIIILCHFYSILISPRFFNNWKIFLKKRIILLDCEKFFCIPLKKCSSSFAAKGERSKGTNERTSKNLQRRADVSRSIVKEQSNHASRKDPR